jgi:hypothetical protein
VQSGPEEEVVFEGIVGHELLSPPDFDNPIEKELEIVVTVGDEA